MQRPDPEYLDTLTERTQEYIAWLEAELERLRAIVDKLPRTADGVPVVPGMEVYYPIRSGTRQGEILQQWVNDSLDVTPCRSTNRVAIYSWYSTREAAEAAGGDDE